MLSRDEHENSCINLESEICYCAKEYLNEGEFPDFLFSQNQEIS